MDSSRKVKVAETNFPANSSPQSTFNNDEFTDFIGDKGYEVEIERALCCPCRAVATGNPRSSCMNCGGSGWIHIDMHKSLILASSMSNRSKYVPWTQENAGTANISARAEDKMSFMDSIKFVELESWFTHVKEVKKSSTNKHFFFTVYQPLRVFELYLFINDETPLKFVEEENFTLTKNRVEFNETFYNTFLTDNNLTDGEITATIRYTHNPVFYVLDANRDMIKLKSINLNVDGKTNFPVNCVARKAHFVLNAPNFNGDKLFDNTNYDRTYPDQKNG